MFGLSTDGGRVKDKKKSPIMLFLTHQENVKTLFDNSINECHFYIYNAVASTNYVYTLKEMLRLKNIKDFVIAMMKVIEDHEERDHWMLFKRADMPKGAKTILSVWAFKIMRLPEGIVTKHKARLNAHGRIQRWGIDYWKIYAPVVNWISVRLLMGLSIIHKLDIKSIDFVLTFPQA